MSRPNSHPNSHPNAASSPITHQPATYFSPAKTNLGLSVLGVQSDGYHELSSLMVPLSVGDSLTFQPAPTLTLAVSGGYGANLSTGVDNLVYRAAHAYLDAAGIGGGVHITLDKQLPLASGLGGGSSNAATTLLALAELFPAEVDLPALALNLGADVPFFLLRGPALAEGVGERLRRVEGLPPVHLVLANVGLEVSAADAYRWLDAAVQKGRDVFGVPLRVSAIRDALELGGTGQGVEVPYFNSLQGGVLREYPEIEACLHTLASAGLHSVLLSGSGATCFGVAQSVAHAESVAQALAEAHAGWWVQAAQVLGGSLEAN